jgi:hypothetical protein
MSEVAGQDQHGGKGLAGFVVVTEFCYADGSAEDWEPTWNVNVRLPKRRPVRPPHDKWPPPPGWRPPGWQRDDDTTAEIDIADDDDEG